MMLMFPLSLVNGFVHRNKSQRVGQAFHSFAKLHKVTNQQDKEFCDRLYQADGEKAWAMIKSRTDNTQ